MRWIGACAPLLLASVALAGPALADELADAFKDPPNSARPRVWWHWMNGNIDKDGIAKDLAWMKRVGIGGLQNFDANLRTPQIVEQRLLYMEDGWKDAFAFTAREAHRLGLALAIAASPGRSETGGPWVPAEDGLKKLVWSQTDVVGGKPFTGRLAAPPAVTGPFQTISRQGTIDSMMSGEGPAKAKHSHYADVAVLAYPAAPLSDAVLPQVTDADGQAIDPANLFDADLGSHVEITAKAAVKSFRLDYARPQTVRSASFFMPGGSVMFFGATVDPRLEVSEDGKDWRKVAEMPVTSVPTTVSFAPVTARHFRIVFAPRKDNALAAFLAASPGVDMAAMGAMPSRSTMPPIPVRCQPIARRIRLRTSL